MTRFRFFPACFAVVAVIVVMVGSALAQQAESTSTNVPELIGEHEYWRVYHLVSDVGEICYIYSEPVSMRPKGVHRGAVLFTITHRGAEVRNEVSMRAGYQFSPESKPFAAIDGKQFSFYTGVTEGEDRAYWAWISAAEEEAALVEAMKKGKEMIVKGTSRRGTLTTDRYSLLGVTKALQSIDEKCQ